VVKMNLRQLLIKHCEKKTPLLINGMGVGKIVKVCDDYIDFEIVKKDNEIFKENVYIIHNHISSISEGGKVVEKTENQKRIENELGDL